MRGEHVEVTEGEIDAMGSSPHARGAHEVVSLLPGRPGIIPACAGSTMIARFRLSYCRDHPRMRGEHIDPENFARFLQGSSPHARGTRFSYGEGEKVVGIIPACAGSTSTRRSTPTSKRDHPRMRGEHT